MPFPSPAPTEEANWKFEFVKPVGITVVGSWALNMCVKRKDGERFTVDLVVEMPSVCLLDAEKLPHLLNYAVGDTPGKGLPQRSVLSQTCTVSRSSGNENIERVPSGTRL